MDSFSNRSILSSIHIEPVDSDEYNRSLVEQLTPYHKQKFLQFVKERGFFNGKLGIAFYRKLPIGNNNSSFPQKCKLAGPGLENYKTFVHFTVSFAHSELDENFLDKLNKYKPKCSRTEWLRIFKAWIDSVRLVERVCCD